MFCILRQIGGKRSFSTIYFGGNVTKSENRRLEIRKKSESRNPKGSMPLRTRVFDFRISDRFRASDFDLRICYGRSNALRIIATLFGTASSAGALPSNSMAT